MTSKELREWLMDEIRTNRPEVSEKEAKAVCEAIINFPGMDTVAGRKHFLKGFFAAWKADHATKP